MPTEIGGMFATLGLVTAPFDAGLKSENSGLDALKKNLTQAGTAHTALGAQATAAGHAHAGFSAQAQAAAHSLRSMTEQLAMGVSPVQLLTQQMGHLSFAATGPGGIKGAFGEVFTALRGLATPAVAAGAGLLAVGAGFAYLLTRTASGSDQVRRFDNILTGFGKSSITTGKALQEVSRQLRDMGVSAADADKTVQSLTRNPIISGSHVGKFATVGADVGARMGVGPVEGITALSTAFSGGVDAVVKFGLSIHALSGPEAQEINRQAALGHETKALNDAFTLISKNVSGEFKRDIAAGKDAVLELKKAWVDFLDSISDSGVMKRMEEILAHDLKELAGLISGKIGFFDTGLSKSILGTLPDAAQKRRDELDHEQSIRDSKSRDPDKRNSGGTTTSDSAASAAATAITKAISTDKLTADVGVLSPAALVRKYESEVLARQLGISPYSIGVGGTDLSKAPLDEFGFPKWAGKMGAAGMSHAAGAYQFEPDTWRQYAKSLGIKDFSESSQDKVFGAAYADQGFGPWAKYNPKLASAIKGGAGTGSGDVITEDQQKIVEAQKALDEFNKTQTQRTANTRLWAIEQQVAEAATAARNAALAQGASAEMAEQRAQIAGTETRKRALIELGKEATVQTARVAGINRVTAALKISEAAAMRQTALEEARIEVMRSGDNADDVAKRKIAERVATKNLELQGAVNDNERSVALVKLEESLQGEVADKITYQVELLKAKQYLEKNGVDATSEMAQNYLKSADNLAKANLNLSRTQKELERFREYGTALESSFSSIFDTLVDGSFKFKNAIGSILKDLGKVAVSQAFKAIFYGEASGGIGAGLFGAIGGLFGFSGKSSSGPGLVDTGKGYLDTEGFADTGSFEVGGSGGIDSQLVQFNATPGEMVNVSKNTFGGGGSGNGEVIRLELNHSDAFVSDMADQRIRTHSGQIIDVAVRRSNQITRRHVESYGAEAQARRA